MRRNGLDHPDTIKRLADQSAIRVDSDSINGTAGLGIRKQHITQLSDCGFVGHGHTKPCEIAQVSHARDGGRQVPGRHLQGHEDRIDATPLQ
jgi:hypothetical protein